MRGGRPLRFLAATLGGWTAVRAFMLWPVAIPVPMAIVRALAPPVAASIRPPIPAAGIALLAQHPSVSVAQMPFRFAVASPVMLTPRTAVELAAVDPDAPVATIPPPLVPTPLARGASRFAGSAWAIVRDGATGSLLGGQLGASQAGVRLTYALGESRRLAIAARAAGPLSGRGAEAAFGVDWQPFAAPIHVIAEQRISLDGGRGGPTAGVIGGLGPRPVAAGFVLEAYGQAGAIARDGIEGFADGAARMSRPVAHLAGLRLDIGAGAWGGIQRGARRVDIGPSIGMRVPVADRAIRLTLDWRARVAGGASPGTGPALSIGSDF